MCLEWCSLTFGQFVIYFVGNKEFLVVSPSSSVETVGRSMFAQLISIDKLVLLCPKKVNLTRAGTSGYTSTT